MKAKLESRALFHIFSLQLFFFLSKSLTSIFFALSFIRNTRKNACFSFAFFPLLFFFFPSIAFLYIFFPFFFLSSFVFRIRQSISVDETSIVIVNFSLCTIHMLRLFRGNKQMPTLDIPRRKR